MSTKPSNKKTVYIAMSADILHPGHLNIIKEGQKLGDVIIGLLTDQAIASYKRVPLMNYDQRLEVITNIKGVSKVLAQKTLDYRPNLLKLKPDYVVHGTDWQDGVQKQTRQQVIDIISDWGGSLIEPEYTIGISSTSLQEKLKSNGLSPTTRLGQLQKLLKSNNIVRAMEAHNGLSALVVEKTQKKDYSGKIEQFDAIWVSRLTGSLAKGESEIELIDRTSRLSTINEILEVTTKPLIVDEGTGGYPEHFIQTVSTLERLGVSAVVIEDKSRLKRNLSNPRSVKHKQENLDTFATKIKAGIKARIHDDFMVIAGIESLVLGKGQDDAISRARTYLEAGASAIMIHSKNKSGDDIKQFARAYNKLPNKKPLILVPNSYNKISEKELKKWGTSIIVYTNHLIRASYPAMEKTALTILENYRATEAEEFCTPVEDLLKIIPNS